MEELTGGGTARDFMNELIADSLRNDPRVKEAVSLLKEASAEHRAKLTGVRPADPDRSGRLVHPDVPGRHGRGRTDVLQVMEECQ